MGVAASRNGIGLARRVGGFGGIVFVVSGFDFFFGHAGVFFDRMGSSADEAFHGRARVGAGDIGSVGGSDGLLILRSTVSAVSLAGLSVTNRQ